MSKDNAIVLFQFTPYNPCQIRFLAQLCRDYMVVGFFQWYEV